MGANLYKIPYVGLSNDTHVFEYQIGDAFFKLFAYSPLQSADIYVELELEKKDTMLVLDFYIAGTIQTTCDRCLEDFPLEIDGHNRLLIKFGEESYEESDEVVVISRGESEIDVSQYIYEFINLLVPYKVVHPDDEDGEPTCDPEILNKIKSLEPGENPKQDHENDPRWEALKNLHNKN